MNQIEQELIENTNVLQQESLKDYSIEDARKVVLSIYYALKKSNQDVLSNAHKDLKESGISISLSKLEQFYKDNEEMYSKIASRIKEEQRVERVILTNMCIIEDKDGNVVAMDKVSGAYRGTTFPGGHIEQHEVFNDAIIREVFEETGLRICHPKMCGVYHWIRDDIHNILFIYHALEFEGTLKTSKEGNVYWIPLSELKKKKLATGSEHVITMVENDSINECVMKHQGDTYVGTLY